MRLAKELGSRLKAAQRRSGAKTKIAQADARPRTFRRAATRISFVYAGYEKFDFAILWMLIHTSPGLVRSQRLL